MRGGVFGAPPAVEYLKSTQKGAAGGVAPLGEDKKVPSANLPDLNAENVGLTAIDGLSAETVQAAIAILAKLLSADGGIATHNHKADEINDGIFGVGRGGTGLNTLTKDSFLVGNGENALQLLTAAQVLAKIGAAASGHNHDTAYAGLNHDHSSLYAALAHNHDSVYSALAHKHSGADITSGLDTLATALSGYLSGAKIATGSYTGTGTYGSSNPCSLTFDFVPRFVAICDPIESYMGLFVVDGPGGLVVFPGYGQSAYNLRITVDGNTVNWYTAESAARFQLNNSDRAYVYFAIC